MNQFFLWAYVQRVRFKTLLAYQKSWRGIPIKENGEPLVAVPEELSNAFYTLDMRIASDPIILLRRSVFERFLRARYILSGFGYDLIVYDGWRSMELQENLFWFYMKEFLIPKYPQVAKLFASVQNPSQIKDVFATLSETFQTTLKEQNRTYVSWPSSNCASPSPHATGGAIDVWLYRDEKPVSLGVPFDWMEVSAGAFYHLKLRREKFNGDRVVARNRNLLIYAMTKVGFSCYGPEIWDYNYGNQMHALVTGGTACYSYIEPS